MVPAVFFFVIINVFLKRVFNQKAISNSVKVILQPGRPLEKACNSAASYIFAQKSNNRTFGVPLFDFAGEVNVRIQKRPLHYWYLCYLLQRERFELWFKEQ